MAVKYGKKRSKQNSVLYTIIATVLLSVVFLGMVNYLYNKAEGEAYENLHVQTKQIKDDIVLQLTSDRENLSTMASFASKLYRDGDDYSLLFESFKPIGMIQEIGILNPDDTFSTKVGTTKMNGVLSFEEEKDKGAYISGLVSDATMEGTQLIRSAVPVRVDGRTVGILYGAIKTDKLGERYEQMVRELDAQLFVYEKETGNILIDTVQDELGNISFLEDREYSDGCSYEQFMSTDKGFVSFESAYRNETLHLHYSVIDEFGWKIAMGRYDSQVLVGAHSRAMVFTLVYFIMLAIIVMYILVLMASGKKLGAITESASSVRKELLETTGDQNNIQDALIEVCKLAKSKSAVFFDTDGEFYHYTAPDQGNLLLSETDKIYFKSELFRYASDFYARNNTTVNILCIKPNRHMLKTNPDYYEFLRKHGIREISLSATINKANHITILATINSARGDRARMLAEKVSACFSMALYNKNYLSRTILAATTDSLTGALNRVAYKNDLINFDREKPLEFSCLYIDVNELHICNNKYGHAAGDEMLLYIANTLKEVFCGQKVYRMGGDEFLVFCQGVEQEAVKKSIEILNRQLKLRNYHVAIGMSYRSQNTDTEEMVKESEVRMYEAKAEYYQNKKQGDIAGQQEKEYVQIETGILEIDTMLSVLKEKYNGIYRVSLSTDRARRILMPAYMNYNENEENFSKLFSKYVAESVDPDYHRALLSFLNYEAIKHQMMEDRVPKITFRKNDGEHVVLSVYRLGNEGDMVSDTLWVFAKE